METRANYVLIGAVTLFGIVAGFVFFIWLASVQVDRQYDHYDILFNDVSGLSQAADVRFNGLSVGQVVSLNLYEKDPSKVRVRIEVDAKTPILKNTTAQLRSQGVTGVSYVALSGGTGDSEPLVGEDGGVPLIIGQRSLVDQLSEDAPDLLSEALKVIKDIQAFTGGENQAYVSGILKNLDDASGRLDAALDDFSSITKTVASATSQISAFTDRLDPISKSLQTALDGADETMTVVREAFAESKTTLTTATEALGKAGSAFEGAEGLIREQIPKLVTELDATVVSLRDAIDGIEGEVRSVLASFGAVGQTADARLVELKTTLSALDTTLANADSALKAVEEASDSFDQLVDGDGVALVAEARDALAKADSALDTIGQVVENDLPGAMADVREAVGTANRVIGTVGDEVTAFTGTLEPLSRNADEVLSTATAALTDVRGTLARLDTTLSGADAALKSITTATDSAGTLIEGDGAALVAEARATLAKADASIAAIGRVVTDDVPGIVADIRSASDTANRVIGIVGDELTDFTGRLTPLSREAEAALSAAMETFRDANATLGRIDTAIGTAEAALTAAEGTFTSANRIIDEEVAPTAESIRTAASELGTAVSDVAADLPAVTAELRATMARASDVVERIDAVVAASAPGVQNFAQTGLPEFVRFTQEARSLVASLERIAARLERDPARFLLGNQPPDFRR